MPLALIIGASLASIFVAGLILYFFFRKVNTPYSDLETGGDVPDIALSESVAPDVPDNDSSCDLIQTETVDDETGEPETPEPAPYEESTTETPVEPIAISFPQYPTLEDVDIEVVLMLETLTESLPKLPSVTFNLLPVLAQPGSGAREVATVIERDQSTAARMLRWVNSSFYGLEGKVTSLQRAVTILGLDTVRSVVLEESFSRSMQIDGIPGLDIETVWRHAAAASVAAKFLARKVRGVEPDVAATAGLLHDIGMLLILMTEHRNLALAIEDVKETGRPLIEAEFDYLGFNHQIWGEAFIIAWRLPEEIAEAIGKHHSPLKEPFNPLAVVLWLSDYLVSHVGFPCPNDNIPAYSDEEIGAIMGRIGLKPPLEQYVTESLVREMLNVTKYWSNDEEQDLDQSKSTATLY
jgi:HD-like signal output (HDOD) protein